MKLYPSLLLFILFSCGYSPVNESEEDALKIYFSFKNNPLNQSLLVEIKKNTSFLNLEISSLDEADLEIEIVNHRIGKFLNATDKKFFPAVGKLDYQFDFYLKTNSKSEFIEFFANEDFAYDTDSILSNEQKIEEIKINFFQQALNELSFRISNFSSNL